MRVQERERAMQREGGRERESEKWGEKGSLSVQRWENSSHTSWCDRWSLRGGGSLESSTITVSAGMCFIELVVPGRPD